MSDRFLSSSKGPAFCQYATSKGQILFERGYWNPMPINTYLSGDGLSHCYRGPAYYVPSERAWVDYKDYHSLPPLTRRDAIHMDSEDKYREFQKKRDSRPHPSGISMSGYPMNFTGVPYPQLVPFQTSAWRRRWNGPGNFVPPGNKWFHENPGSLHEAYKFYNEEDYEKFKHLSEKPTCYQKVSR
ncbi:unnamed protein product [Candidula unifasciata]|uniref:Uncharacterized protein n=1 Tax=Candidula unifasciata TaxID=100452 RepID=A0A8S3ZIW1_9EUPU|nr:unnamed protein product [Candidula unifasciata]